MRASSELAFTHTNGTISNEVTLRATLGSRRAAWNNKSTGHLAARIDCEGKLFPSTLDGIFTPVARHSHAHARSSAQAGVATSAGGGPRLSQRRSGGAPAETAVMAEPGQGTVCFVADTATEWVTPPPPLSSAPFPYRSWAASLATIPHAARFGCRGLLRNGGQLVHAAPSRCRATSWMALPLRRMCAPEGAHLTARLSRASCRSPWGPHDDHACSGLAL